MKEFQVAHEQKVLEIYKVTIPNDVEMPEDFDKWSFTKMDEWLWEHQSSMDLITRDHIDGQCVMVMPYKALSLKVVK